MLTLDLREQIRRAYYLDHKSIRQISEEVRHSRETVSRVISENPPDASKPPRRHKLSPVFGPFQSRIDELMERNERLPKKQHYTSHKIFELLQAEGYQGCESRVRQYIAAWKRVHEAPDVFIPLEFEPGQDAQCDWGEAIAVSCQPWVRASSTSSCSIRRRRRSRGAYSGEVTNLAQVRYKSHSQGPSWGRRRHLPSSSSVWK